MEKNPKVVVSVFGRFHAFNLAKELLKFNALEKLITTYPKFITRKWGFPNNKVFSLSLAEVIQRAYFKLPSFLKKFYNPQFLIAEIFDKSVEKSLKKIDNFDIFVGFSSKSLHSLKKAKKLGKITIIERGSSHILYQSKILREEYGRFNARYNGPLKKIIEKSKQEYQLADYIAIPSSFVEKSFLEYGFPKEKLIKNPYGVDINEFRQIPKQDNVFRVVFAGGMSIRKGVHYLLQAFAELNLPNSELLLVGSFNEEIRPFFKKYEGKFKWVDHKPQKELYKYYSQGSIFVMPSIEEGMAMVQLQAMACGLPLICTPNTGGEDLIEQGKQGFVVPIRDVEALKEKILYFYKNPDIAYEMGQNAKRKVQENYTWEKYGQRAFEIYKNLLNK